MDTRRGSLIIGFVLLLTACGGDGPIDRVKDAYVDACPGADIGDMLITYFPSTTWTAYNGSTDTTKIIYGEGDIQYVGVTRRAKIGFELDETTGSVRMLGLEFNGQAQPQGMLDALISNMCEEAS